MADEPSGRPLEPAAIVKQAHDTLVTSIEKVRCSLGLDRDPAAILGEIKKTMHTTRVPPHDFTVFQALCERECQDVFNQSAAGEFPEIREKFEDGIRDRVRAREGIGVPARRIHQIARNAWKQDPGADRRTREMEQESPDQFRSPYRARPEQYDPQVVLAFENSVASAIGRPRVSWTRGTEDNKSSGVMLDVLVAAVQWAMCVAWQWSAPPESSPPKVKAEGILGIVKAKGVKNRTD